MKQNLGIFSFLAVMGEGGDQTIKVAQTGLKCILVQEILKPDEIFEVCKWSQIR